MKFVFRVDSTVESGAGHGMRCYALAEKAIERGHHVIFLGSYTGFPWFVEKLNQLGVLIFEIKTELEINLKLKEINPDFVVIDSYLIPDEWVTKTSLNFKTLAIVDSENQLTNATIFLDQNVNKWSENFVEKAESIYLRGSSYALIRDEIVANRKFNFTSNPNSETLNILVLTGGSDLEGAAIKFAQLISELKLAQHLKLQFVTRNSHHEKLMSYGTRNLEIKVQNPTNSLGPIFSGIDLAITLGGTSVWELATACIPVVVACAVANQEQSLKTVEDLGIGVSLGWIWNEKFLENKNVSLLSEIIQNKNSRINFKEQSYKHFDGRGRDRVLDILERYN